ncbi:GntR family transcriptional regulator [Clostridium sp. AN503]|uniref:FadR/GntR family transcriptional regulator n=1 Tax=Clostridium sp. AN503 TaxID=3160598 RepID=UPI003459FE21
MKIKKVSVVDQVSEALKEKLLNHTWEPGDKLPSEGELADTFGVNRLSVRMALQKLNTLGLLETRVGEGTYVREFSMAPYMDEIADIYLDEKRLNDVRELRNLLEGEAMRIAAASSTVEEQEELKRRLKVYEEKRSRVKEDPESETALDEMAEADFEFHHQVIRMSHNDLYVDIYLMTKKVIVRHIRDLLKSRVSKEIELEKKSGRRVDEHYEVINGICNGDVEALTRSRERMLRIRPIPDFGE